MLARLILGTLIALGFGAIGLYQSGKAVPSGRSGVGLTYLLISSTLFVAGAYGAYAIATTITTLIQRFGYSLVSLTIIVAAFAAAVILFVTGLFSVTQNPPFHRGGSIDTSLHTHVPPLQRNGRK